MNLQKESEIERYLRTKIESLGGIAMKFVSPGDSGVPDRVVIFPNGKVVWVEMKRVGGKLSPMQLVKHEELRRLKQEVVVLWSKTDVDSFVATCAE